MLCSHQKRKSLLMMKLTVRKYFSGINLGTRHWNVVNVLQQNSPPEWILINSSTKLELFVCAQAWESIAITYSFVYVKLDSREGKWQRKKTFLLSSFESRLSEKAHQSGHSGQRINSIENMNKHFPASPAHESACASAPAFGGDECFSWELNWIITSQTPRCLLFPRERSESAAITMWF